MALMVTNAKLEQFLASHNPEHLSHVEVEALAAEVKRSRKFIRMLKGDPDPNPPSELEGYTAKLLKEHKQCHA